MGYGGHLVRVGSMGNVGLFDTADGSCYARRARVICRTPRGLEVGEVLANGDKSGRPVDGRLLRRVSIQDEMLIERIDRRKSQAYQACATLLANRGLPAVLMDVEHLFDGQSLFFYFLGEVTRELEEVTTELAEAYEAKVQFRKFTQTLLDGCGPDCGVGEGSCGVGGCGTCALTDACSRGSA